jgi:hypothetical protein
MDEFGVAVNKLLVEFVAVVAVVAFPDKAPLKVVAVTTDVDGLYVNNVPVVSSTYKGVEALPGVLINGIK